VVPDWVFHAANVLLAVLAVLALIGVVSVVRWLL
jgi:hypothetical protein